MVLNEKRDYPLEMQLRTLARVPSSYVVAIFDCCRQNMSAAMRGVTDPEDIKLGLKEDDDINLYMSFGCAPSDSVPAKSTLVENYFLHLRKQAHGYDGSVLLP